MEVWAIGRLGMDDVEGRSQASSASAESSGLSMTMAAAGLRQPLRQVAGLELSIVGGAGLGYPRRKGNER